MERVNYSSGAKWEELIGYSRAVKIGNTIEITGTVAVDANGHTVGLDNAYEQTCFIIQKIERTLLEAGAGLSDVIRTRMFVTNISKWEEYGKAHREYFRNIKPCTTMVEVSSLISKEFLIEMEATAIMK